MQTTGYTAASYHQWIIEGLGGPLTEVELVCNFWLLLVSFGGSAIWSVLYR